MNTRFKHFILTRFNLINEQQYDVSYDYVNSDEYLLERFRLFELFCFPSVSGQTNKNFTWLVLFNDKLPGKWKNKCEDYKKKCPNFEPRYLSAVETREWKNMLNKLILDEIDDCDFVLTTRLDNDDAIYLSFVDSIQKYFLENQEEAIINYADGLQYIPKYNILKNTTFPKSHFNTLIEKNTSNLQTVLSFAHSELSNSFNSVFLKEKTPMWLEVIHSTNVVNTTFFQINNLLNDLFFIGFKYKNLNDFGIKQDIPIFNFYVWKVFFEYAFIKFKEKIIYKILRK